MHLPSTLRHAVVTAVVGLSLAASAVLATAQPRGASRGGTEPAPVMGLIVQLRDAPSHAELAHDQADGRGGATAQREATRWLRLVAEWRADAAVLRELPAWADAAPQRDPVGASAQLLRFARPLTPEQADRVAARLAARPEVAWVAPNTRERRQATANNAPNDPRYPDTAGASGQWWLHPLQGSNGVPIANRLRGVPSFLPAWLNSSIGDAAAVVAVLDSGITCHPDLGNLAPAAGCIGGAILPGYDFVADWDPVLNRGYANDNDGRDADPRDPGDWVSADDQSADPARYASCDVGGSSWHGTVNAGIVAARTNNNSGVAGINWNGRVLPVRVAGKCGAEVADIIEGMRWAAGLPACKRSNGAGGCAEPAPPNPNPARIINISFGGSGSCDAYQATIDELRARGVVVVAAAGNGWGAPMRPAKCPGVIGVGALNRDGFKTNYSSFGAALTISTVGGDDDDGTWGPMLADSGVLTVGNGGSTVPGSEDYYYHFGTSFSAPIVSGAISLMLSVTPTLTADQIVQGLTLSARPHVTFPAGVPNLDLCGDANPGRCQCTTSTCGAGILDAQQALLYASNPGAYVNTRAFGDLIDTVELRAAAALGPDRAANAPPPPTGGGGGGGVMSGGWLLALALAAWALRGPISAPQSGPWRRARSRRRAPRC